MILTEIKQTMRTGANAEGTIHDYLYISKF